MAVSVRPISKALNGCLIASAIIFFGCPQAQAVSIEEATREFNKGRFNKASESFKTIVDADANNFNARCYLAASLLRLGRKNEAMEHYWTLVRKFPDNPEVKRIKFYLYKNDTNFTKNAALNASMVGDNAPGDAEIPQSKLKGKRPNTATELAEAMVGRVKPLKDRPEVTSLLVMDIKAALSEYPLSILNLLYSKGCRILISPTYIDRDPQSANSRPQGFEYGSTWKDCPGRFDGRDIVVCEYTIGNDVLEKASDPIGILRHEMGHAIDRFLGEISNTTDFKQAYSQDIHGLDEFVKPRLRYYIQTEGNGPAETFAELAAAKYGGKSQSGSRKNRSASIANLVYDNFPNANKVLENKLSSFQ